MNSELIQLLDVFEDLNDYERKWVFANLNNIIEKFNEKFKKNINIKFSSDWCL